MGSSSKGYHQHRKHEAPSPTGNPIWMKLCRNILHLFAFVFALAPTVLKMYETSHWFRNEDDPSPYDLAREYFGSASIPYAKSFHHDDKTMMRVYFFILPYIFSAFCVSTSHLLKGRSNGLSPTSHHHAHHRMNTASKFHLIVRSLLGLQWSIPKFAQRFLWLPHQVSTSEILGIAVFLFLNLGTLVVRVKRSYPRGTRKLTFLVDIDEDLGKEPIPHMSWEGCEIWALTFGILAIMNLAWYLILPIGRRSVVLEAFNLSWERAITYHRWIGYYTLILVVLHGFMYASVWLYGNGNQRFDPDGYMILRNLVPWGCNTAEICDDDQRLQLRINYYGITSFVFMLTMTCFTLPYIRRNFYEWFYYTHHLFIFVLFFLCLHYKGAFIYLIPGVAIYMVDKLYPLLAYRSSGTVHTNLRSPDVLEVRVPTSNQNYFGGAYVFLNVPSVSWLQWHPYSLTSAPGHDGDDLVFHLKNTGNWTKEVIKAAKKAKKKGSALTVRIDGMYGHKATEALSIKDAVVLVGGGIGITPMISIARDLSRRSSNVPVTLLWVVRTISEYNVLSKELRELVLTDVVDVRVWITMSEEEPDCIGDTEESIPRITKECISNLADDVQVDQVIDFLTAIRNKYGDTEDEESFRPTYRFNGYGFHPATNAFVMGLSVIVGLTAYAVTYHVGEVSEIQPADKLGLLHMFMIMLWLVIFIVTIGIIRYLWPSSSQGSTTGSTPNTKTQQTKTTNKKKMHSKRESTTSTTHRYDSSHLSHTEVHDPTDVKLDSSSSSNYSNRGSGDDGGYDDDDAMSSLELERSMMMGRIGCRPNLVSEFRNISQVHTKNYRIRNVNVGVLACGPKALVNGITEICNKQQCGGCRCNFDMELEDGSNAYFSFTEEDWEW